MNLPAANYWVIQMAYESMDIKQIALDLYGNPWKIYYVGYTKEEILKLEPTIENPEILAAVKATDFETADAKLFKAGFEAGEDYTKMRLLSKIGIR